MSDVVSAKGERAAIGGYLPQFNEFAWFAYRELVNSSLEWIRVADPQAQKLDDIQYATVSEVHAYQVKWSIAADVFSFTDFKNLLPALVTSWQGLRALYTPQNKRVIGHLLTNKPLSKNDRIQHGLALLGSFADLHQNLWLKLKAKQAHDSKWAPVVKELQSLTGLDEIQFADFIEHFVFHPAYKPEEFNVSTARHKQQHDDLEKLRSYILEKVGDASRPVEFKSAEIIAALGWESRFKTTFNHELFVDKKRYQPLTFTLTALTEKLEKHQKGYLFLVGGPGTGKSTLLTEWSKGRAERVVNYYAFDFSNPSSPKNYHERGSSTSLYFDLVVQLREAGVQGDAVLPYKDLAYLRDVFYKQVELLGEDFALTGKKTVLVIDGLDHIPREYETVINSFLRDLPPPASLPLGVYIVLGSQSYELDGISEEIKAEWRGGNRSITIAPLNRNEVFRYAEASLSSADLTQHYKQLLFEKSQGHPLYLSYLVEILASSTNWQETLEAVTPINGDIEVYYRKMWRPIQTNAELIDLLGLMARINGSINVDFVSEWGFKNQILIDFAKQAKFLFSNSLHNWSFFHNSFRQFIFKQTAQNPLTGNHDATVEAEYHTRLAAFYNTSVVEPSWNALAHLYKAGAFSRFLEAATPSHFVQHLLDFRPVEEIRRDIQLGVEIAAHLRDVPVLVRYLFALAELERRLVNVTPASFVEEFLVMGKPAIARNYLRNGSTLLTSEAFALKAARLFYEHADHTEAAMLFALAEPDAVKQAAIVIDEDQQYAEASSTLENWADVALYFYPLSEVLARINNIQFAGDNQHRRPHESVDNFRLDLLAQVAQSAMHLGKWEAAETILQAIDTGEKSDKQTYFEVVQAAVDSCVANEAFDPARHFLNLLLEVFPLDKTTDIGKIYIADIIYKVSGNAELVSEWIEAVPQPLTLARDSSDFSITLEVFNPFIKLNKLLHLLGKGVSLTTAVPSARAGTDEEVFVEFLRMLLLITEVQAHGLKGSPYYGDIAKQMLPVVRYYYKEVSHHNRYWYPLKRRQSAYFEFLIQAVGMLGGKKLNQLAEFMFHEFLASARYWPADIKRSIILSLVEQGYDPIRAKDQLELLEPTMLEGKDIDGRTSGCLAQAQAWLAVKGHAQAERWLRQTVQESIGVGYRKDYQFSTWLDWLQKLNVTQPEHAQERILWFLSHLKHIRDTTEGGAFWRASESVLQTTFAWNFAAGQKQLQWQLQQGLIQFEAALETFMLRYIELTTTPAEFADIVYFYATIFLPISHDAGATLLQHLLQKGFELEGEKLFHKHLSHLVNVISIKALEQKRGELLMAVDEFVTAQGFVVTTYCPSFQVPAVEEDRASHHKNELTIKPDHAKLTEEEVLARAGSYEELQALLDAEDKANSSFNWAAVLIKLTPDLTASQIRSLADGVPNERRKSPFYSALSAAALQIGDSTLAGLLAEKAVQASGESGWVVGYDGGTRLKAFAAMQQIDPVRGRQKAFEVFAHDVVNSNYPSFYIESLDDILPLLTDQYGVDGIWDEVFGYLHRLMANSQPTQLLPDISPEGVSIGQVLIDLLAYLAKHPVSIINQEARKALAVCLEQGNPNAWICIQQLGEGTLEDAEVCIDCLMLARQAALPTGIVRVLNRLAVAGDFLNRKSARELLSVAGQPLPPVPTGSLPAVYSLRLEEAKGLVARKDLAHGVPTVNLGNPQELVRPFLGLVNMLAKAAGLNKSLVVHRTAALMHELQDPACWTVEYEDKLRGHLSEIALNYSYTRPRVASARRALLHVATELVDAGVLNAEQVTPALLFHDYQVDAFPEVAKPPFIQTLKQQQYSHVPSDWIETIHESERLQQGLVMHSSGWAVIGEYTRVQSLNWGAPTETFMCQLAVDGEADDEDDTYIFGSVFHRLTEEYYDLAVPGSCIILLRDHHFNQFSLKSQWLAINPLLAKYLGWQPDPGKLFGWKDSEGVPVVESIYWANGNVDMPPPRLESEAGEGWVVLASPAALVKLAELGGELWLEKELTRSQWKDQQHLQNTVTTRIAYPKQTC